MYIFQTNNIKHFIEIFITLKDNKYMYVNTVQDVYDNTHNWMVTNVSSTFCLISVLVRSACSLGEEIGTTYEV